MAPEVHIRGKLPHKPNMLQDGYNLTKGSSVGGLGKPNMLQDGFT